MAPIFKQIAFRQWLESYEHMTPIHPCPLPYRDLLDQEFRFQQVELRSWLDLNPEDRLLFEQYKTILSTQIYWRKGSYYIRIVFLG